MIERLICFGDSFTEGEGAWLEKTVEIENQYKEPSEGRLKVAEFNYNYSWPKILGDSMGIKAENYGSCGASNNHIFNSIFKFDLSGQILDDALIVVMWSSVIRDKLPFFPKLFSDNGPIGLGWSFNELAEDFASETFSKRYYKNINNKDYIEEKLLPFMKEYFKKYIVNCYDSSFYNTLNFNYIYFLQEFFKSHGVSYIFIDAFESMNSFDPKNKKWDLIDKTKYWKFGESTAWDYINNIGGDVFENLELSFNPPGQKCHPNRHGYKLIAEELFRFYKKSLDN